MKKLFFVIVAFFFLFSPVVASAAPITTTDKLITVDLATQDLKAWNGGKVVYETPVSSGLPLSPTVRGTFHIYAKHPLQEMKGYSPYKGNYDLPNVPNVMYFYEGYSIHGAYWHNNFGHPMSNGCVNVSLPAAAWLYNFAPLGTRVEVY